MKLSELNPGQRFYTNNTPYIVIEFNGPFVGKEDIKNFIFYVSLSNGKMEFIEKARADEVDVL